MGDAPNPKRIRVVVCRGQYCNMGRRADKILKQLEVLVEEVNGDQYPKPVKLEIANCLSMCGAGPNIVLYPEGVIYNNADESMVQIIVDSRLKRDG